MNRSKSIVVVGAGVIGLCTAYYALKRGHRVCVIEKEGPEHDGCSKSNAGMIVPSHFVPLASPAMLAKGLRMMWRPRSPFGLRPSLKPVVWRWGWRFVRSASKRHVQRAAPVLRDLSLASRECFVEMSAERGADFGLVERGLLMICVSGKGMAAEAALAAQARELGLQAEVLEADQLRRIEPGLDVCAVGAVRFPQDAHLVPERFMAFLAARVEAMGGEIRWQSEIRGWETAGSTVRAARTATGTVSGEEFVVAAGTWTPQLVRELGVSVPILPGKGYSLTCTTPPQLPGHCAILTEAHLAVTPMDRALRLAGTMEIGLTDRRINRPRVEGLIRSACRFFPRLRPEMLSRLPVWSGLRPCCPDGLPCVGRVHSWDNLIVAAGHAMLGLSLGPVTGRLVTELLSDAEPGKSLELLSPDRFA